MKKIILLTGNEIRHQFFRKFLNNNRKIQVIAAYCESTSGNINELIKKDSDHNLISAHLTSRNVTEKDFFESYVKEFDDKKSIHIKRGEINDELHVDNIINLNPDLLISYGCSIIKSKLLNVFNKMFINIHLGLSPYYRGAGTNFWPFVNNELSLIGTTFMHIDEGIDTGEVIHQIRANIFPEDNIHTIGNRLILDSFKTCVKLILNLEYIHNSNSNDDKFVIKKLYKQKDFNEESIKIAKMGLNKKINDYLKNKSIIDKKYPLVKANI